MKFSPKKHIITTGTVVVIVFVVVILSAPASAQVSTETEASVVDIRHDSPVAADGSFEVTVETRDSAGTVVAIEPEGFQVEISSNEGDVDGDQVRFLDPSAGDSEYTIEVDVVGGESGDTAEIAAWVNAEKRVDAPDISTSIVRIGDSETNSGQSDKNTKDSDSSTNNKDNTDNQTVDEGDSIGNNTSEIDRSTTNDSNKINRTNTNQTPGADSSTDQNQTNTSKLENSGDKSDRKAGNDTSDRIPGFNFIIGIISLIGGTYMLSRRRD